jgi:hypothetical protein
LNANLMRARARDLGFEVELADGEPERKYGRRPERAPRRSKTRQKSSKFAPGQARARFRPRLRRRVDPDTVRD